MTDRVMTNSVSGVPNAEGTPRRSVRVGPLWDEAKAAAEYNGETLTQVINEFLEDYVRRTCRQKVRREKAGLDEGED